MRPVVRSTLVAIVGLVGLSWFLWIGNWGERKVDSYYAALRSDLRRVAQAQADYFTANGRYTTVIDSLPDTRSGFSVAPSIGVEIVIVRADDAGWEAIGTHESLRTRCVYRDGAPPRPVPGFGAFNDFCSDPP